jgi:hypothetical protein
LEVLEREEFMYRIEVFIVLAVTALNLAVMPGSIRLDELVTDSQFP